MTRSRIDHNKIEASYSRPVKAKLIVRTEHGEEWEATKEDLDKFGYGNKLDLYTRTAQMFAEGIGLEHFDELTDDEHEKANLVRYVIECGIMYDHSPWANEKGEPWSQEDDPEPTYKDRLRAVFAKDAEQPLDARHAMQKAIWENCIRPDNNEWTTYTDALVLAECAAKGLTDSGYIVKRADAEPKVLAEGPVDHYTSPTSHEEDNALIAIEVGREGARNLTSGQRVQIIEADA